MIALAVVVLLGWLAYIGLWWAFIGVTGALIAVYRFSEKAWRRRWMLRYTFRR